MANKSVTKYKSVSNNVLVKETKLRTEYQTLNYPATEHEVKAKIKARVATKNAEYSNLYKYDNKFIEHYASFDKAKLRPSLFKGDGLLKFKKRFTYEFESWYNQKVRKTMGIKILF